VNVPELIREYGYAAIVIGTFFEGEAIMLAAGVAASAGLLSLPLVVAASMGGIFASDMFCFLLGRLAGPRLSRWFPRMYARLGPVFGLVERHSEKLIIFYQFFPGLCTVTPVAFGMSRIPALRFMTLDLVGNALWTVVFSVGGYYAAAGVRSVAAGLQGWAPVIYGCIAVGLAVWFIRRERRPVGRYS
jgi:membrane protein DedA with SNARE-associated domain